MFTFTSWMKYLLLLILLQAVTGYAAEPENHAAQTLVAAIPRHVPPQYQLDNNGNPSGFAIEVMDGIAETAGLNIEYLIKEDWPATFAALQNGEADIIPNMGISTKRREQYDYTRPVEIFVVSIFVRDSNHTTHKLDDLTHKTVATVKGNVSVNILKQVPEIRSRIMSDVKLTLFSLLSGEVDAIVYPEPWIYTSAIRAGIDDKIKTAGPPLREVKRAIAIRKGNPILLRQLNTAVNTFKASPAYRQIFTKWYATPRAYWTVQRVIIFAVSIMIFLLFITAALHYLSTLKLNKKLHKSIEKQKLAETELNIHREHLQDMIKDRTEELQASNNELESFCYSVSHDLRAPLRAIDGYSLALTEDCLDNLDEHGKKYLERIHQNTLYMSHLIDDLLNLSRLGRIDISPRPVKIAQIINDVFTNIQSAYPQQKLELVCRLEEAEIKGDPVLLRVVMENLLGNAAKYSRHRDISKITAGTQQMKGRKIYYIKDNGCGFDMQHSSKLFGIFQRLHNDNEFEGTGIGLATVQRIIKRHGGEIWANAKPDAGATFYFTLGDSGQVH